MSSEPWIKLIAPPHRYKSSGQGRRWINIRAKCHYRCKDTKKAALQIMATHRQLQLRIDKRPYDLPFKGGPGSERFATDINDHLRHCIDMHKAFYDEQS